MMRDTGQEAARDRYNRGVELLEQGNTRDAVAAFEDALKADPAYVAASYNLGAAWMRLGRPDAAAEAFGRTTELAPDLPRGWFMLGSALGALGRHEESVAATTRGLDLAPESAEGWHNLGWAALNGGNAAAAVRAFRRLADLRPESARVHYLLAKACRLAHQFADEMAAYRAAIERQSDYADAILGLGVAFARERLPGAPLEYIETEGTLRLDDPDVVLRLALGLAAAGATDAPAELLESLKKMAPAKAEMLAQVLAASTG